MKSSHTMRALRRIALVGLSMCCLLQLASAQNSFGGSPVPPASAPTPPKSVKPEAMPGVGTASDTAGQAERKDFGVAAKNQLHDGAMHGPTPASIPGAQIITTQALVELLRNAKSRALVFDVLGGPEALPGALAAAPAHRPGSFDDATQREFGQFLQQVTQGSKDMPLVFYCQSVQCWMSYNAALRAARLGYSRVLWYRGGIEAWKQAGQPVQTAPGAAR